jgi:diguanylate cyclase (GGDEF)-like protein
MPDALPPRASMEPCPPPGGIGSPTLAARGHPARSSLAAKIIFVVFLATFLTAVLISWASVYSTHTFLERKIQETYPALLAGAADRSTGWLDAGLFALAGLAEGKGSADRAELEAWLRSSPHFEALVRTDAEGGTALSVGSAARIEPPAKPGLWVAEDAEGEQRFGAALIPASGVPCCLHGIFAPGRLRPLLAVDGLGPGGAVRLADDTGNVLVSGRLDARRPPGSTLPFAALAGGEVADYIDSRGTRWVGALRAIPGTPLSVVVEEPYEEAFEPVFSMVKRVFVIDLGILIVFSLVAYRVTGAIVQPIEALSDGARRISQGELDVELVESESRDEVGLLTRTFNDMTRKLLSHRAEIERANQKLMAQNAELQRANEVLEQLSITDGLTRLHNHRFFQDHLTREIKRVSRTAESLSMLMCDIDDFKRLNDRLGHAAGDELLVGISRTLDESIRDTDFLARYGGEEFVVLCPDTDLAGAVTVAEKVRNAVAEGSFLLDSTSQLSKITISIGVAQFEGSRRGFFQEADQALYRAKAAGKNCVKAAGELPGFPDA